MYILFDDIHHMPVAFAEHAEPLKRLAYRKMMLTCYISELEYENGMYTIDGMIVWERRDGRIVYDVCDSCL